MEASKKTGREPLLRTVKRAELSQKKTMILRAASVLLALLAGGIFLLIIGFNPFTVYQTIISGAFRSEMAVQATIRIMIPLLISSLGVTMAFKMRFWNIGADHYGSNFCHLFCAVSKCDASCSSADRYVFIQCDRGRAVRLDTGVFQGEVQYQ